jgi:hypothetical protein
LIDGVLKIWVYNVNECKKVEEKRIGHEVDTYS